MKTIDKNNSANNLHLSFQASFTKIIHNHKCQINKTLKMVMEITMNNQSIPLFRKITKDIIKSYINGITYTICIQFMKTLKCLMIMQTIRLIEIYEVMTT
jgi:hypothetical protein